MEHKNQSPHENMQAMNHNQRPKIIAQNETHKVKNFAYTASKPRLPKSDGLPTNLPKDSLNSK